MIGTVGYVILMHHYSPLAWLGHKRKWMRMRECQYRMRANRNYPEYFPPVRWAQLIGLSEFDGSIPRINGRNCFKNEHEVFMHLFKGCFARWVDGTKRWLYPNRYGAPSDWDIEMWLGDVTDRDRQVVPCSYSNGIGWP